MLLSSKDGVGLNVKTPHWRGFTTIVRPSGCRPDETAVHSVAHMHCMGRLPTQCRPAGDQAPRKQKPSPTGTRAFVLGARRAEAGFRHAGAPARPNRYRGFLSQRSRSNPRSSYLADSITCSRYTRQVSWEVLVTDRACSVQDNSPPHGRPAQVLDQARMGGVLCFRARRSRGLPNGGSSRREARPPQRHR